MHIAGVVLLIPINSSFELDWWRLRVCHLFINTIHRLSITILCFHILNTATCTNYQNKWPLGAANWSIGNLAWHSIQFHCIHRLGRSVLGKYDSLQLSVIESFSEIMLA